MALTSATSADIELDVKQDEPDVPEKNVLFVSTDNISYVISKYQKKENDILLFIEYVRWKLNLFFLFKPFAFLSYIPIPRHYHQCIYQLTCTEIIFYTILICLSYSQIIWFFTTFKNTPILIWNSSAVIGGGDSDSHDDDSNDDNSDLAEKTFVITWVLSARVTLWNIFFGLSFERSIQFHRIFAYFAIFMGVIHFWNYRNYAWFEGKCYSGSMALIPALIMLVTSLNIIRRKLFTIFLKIHWIGFIMIAIFMIQHDAKLILVGVGVSVVDLIIRGYSTFGKKVIIKDIKLLHGNVIRIDFIKDDFKYSAGQYIFLCIPAIDFTQYHPFSISSSPHHDDIISIHIRVLGDWTFKLQKLAAYYQQKNKTNYSDVLCFMEGPYGTLSVPNLHQYESIIMISGGIGITPLQSIFNEIIHHLSTNSNNNNNNNGLLTDSVIKKIHFVWTVRDPSMLNEFDTRHWSGIQYKDITYSDATQQQQKQPLKDAYDSDNNDNNVVIPKYFSPNLLIVKHESEIIHRAEVITHFYVTRVVNDDIKEQYIKNYQTLKFGRPSIQNIIKDAKNEYKSNNNTRNKLTDSCICSTNVGNGVVVLSCGPKSMLKDVTHYATQYGVDCHTEIFNF